MASALGLAQDKPEQPTSEVDSKTDATQDRPPAEGTAAEETAAEEQGDETEESTSDGDEDSATRIAADYGIEPGLLTTVESLTSLLEENRAEAAKVAAGADALERNQLKLSVKLDTLRSQPVEGLPEFVQSRMSRSIASSAIAKGLVDAQLASIERRKAALDELNARLDVLRESIETRTAEELDAEMAQRLRQEEAQEEEAQAVEAVEQARAREARERDETMRKLLAREREIAERMLELTRSINQDMTRITEHSADVDRMLSDSKAALLADVDSLPKALANAEERQQKVDPLVSRARHIRAQARDELNDAYRAYETHRSAVSKLEEELAAAQAKLAEEKARESQSSTSELFTQRLKIAQGEVDLAKKRLDTTLELKTAMASRIEMLEAHEKSSESTLDRLMERATSAGRTAGFRLLDQNVERATAGLELAYYRIRKVATERVSQLLDFRELLFGFTVWSWLGGLLLRFIPLGLLVFFLPWVPTGLRKLLSRAMSSRFFRRRPAITIKVVEVLNEVTRPALMYFAVVYIANYVIETFPELTYGLHVIDAVFAYMIITVVTQVTFLPRSIREQLGSTTAEDLGLHGQDLTAELVGIHEDRGKKVVRSVRVVTVFWLLADLIPGFVDSVLGVSLIWYWIDLMATWGLAVIIYWVISTWRTEIATLFEKLAKDRLPWAANFVKEHNDRFYGVIVTAVAFVYVVVVEAARFGRKYVLNTEWFKKASNFAFRKRIELQQREREEQEVEEWEQRELPSSYLDVFYDQPLEDGEFYVARDGDYVGQMLTRLEEWRVEPKQGSIALISETGMGRTSILNRLETNLDELLKSIELQTEEPASGEEVEGDDSESVAPSPTPFDVIRRTAANKLTRRNDVLDWVADLFGLDRAPKSIDDMVARLEEMPAKVLLVDDAHHFFMRQIGGFDALDALLDIVALTDHRHFWILTFNQYSWEYVNRVKSRFHQVGEIIRIMPWSESEMQRMIETRNARTEFSLNYTDLVVAEEEEMREDAYYEVVKSAKGYFRYLHEFSGGNPRLAMVYWLRSLRPGDSESELAVTLFRRPKTSEFFHLTDDHWFVLTALAQHDELDAREIASIINSEEGFCALAINFFFERGFIERSRTSHRARLAPLYFRQIMKRLTNSNYLYS